MDLLIQEQKILYDEFDKFQKNVKKAPIERKQSKGYLAGRLSGLKELWVKFEDNNRKILLIFTEADNDKDYFTNDVFNATECSYYDLLGRLTDMLDAVTAIIGPLENMPTPPRHGHHSSPARLKLPPIQIPTFDGSYHTWLPFKELFEAIVDKDEHLSFVQKFHYLKSSLVGDAAKLIQHLQVVGMNYAPAWEMLVNRYNNKRILVNTQLKALMSLPGQKSETAQGLRGLLDGAMECLQSLHSIGIAIKSWDPILIYILSEKLAYESHTKWEAHLSEKQADEMPNLVEFQKFLEGRFRTLEAMAQSSSKPKMESRLPSTSNFFNSSRSYPPRTRHSFHTSTDRQSFQAGTDRQSFHASTDRQCSLCHANHYLVHCEKFRSLNVVERLNQVRKAALCYNCLAPGHSSRDCGNMFRCKMCNQKHHSFLHTDTRNPPPRTISSLHVNQHETSVLLATALVPIKTVSGLITVRALLDQGSQASLVTERAVQLLGLKKIYTAPTILTGLSELDAGEIKFMVKLRMSSLVNPSYEIDIEALVIRNITGELPSYNSIREDLNYLNNEELADPRFDEPGKIDLLLGADVYGEILEDGGGVRRGRRGGPVAQNTKLGWILSGKVRTSRYRSLLVNYGGEDNLEDLVRRFWEIEEVEVEHQLTPKEQRCEELFKSCHYRKEDGRYVVPLCFKEDAVMLGSSRQIAIRRQTYLERRFVQNPDLSKEYSKYMKEYIQQNHMVEVPSSESANYLPHHAIFKPTSTTTKLRVVYDASCKTTSSYSLNDMLLVGPTIQEELSSILLRWMKYRIVFTADVEKMYLQIQVRDEDLNYQRIVWRNSQSESLRDYVLKTLTFGTACAPFLAVRTLRQLAEDEGSRFPKAAEVVRRDFYMDDLISGCYEVSEAIELQGQLTKLLSAGKFNLRKWTTNSSELLKSIAPNDREIELIDLSTTKSDKVIKTLGLYFNPCQDRFTFKVNRPSTETRATKRTLLSEVAKLFDPLGWIGPVIITAKILYQDLWIAGIQWDDFLPEVIDTKWKEFSNELPELEKIKIPRWIHYLPNQKTELHGFSDASELAYAASIYARTTEYNGIVHTKIVTSKNRLAPIKKVSIPKLELNGAVLLARLLKRVQKDLQIESMKVTAWTDSTIVLAWLKKPPGNWQTYVANRVSEVQTLMCGSQWRHVASGDNPADCASRGLMPAELKNHPLWWSGPEWLKKPESEWPSTDPTLESTTLEIKKVKGMMVREDDFCSDLLNSLSSFTSVIRITALCRRYLNNLRVKAENRLGGHLSVQELGESREFWWKKQQSWSFAKEIKQLRAKEQLESSSRILQLNPFLDSSGLLRVGGRLQNSSLSFDQKHPILISTSGRLTSLLVRETHLNTLHGGIQLVLNMIRKKYWIVNGRQTVKNVIHQCVQCYRFSSKCSNQLMGDLPTPRVTSNRPFLHTGVDFTGAVEIRTSAGRGRIKTVKGYICVFVCLATKAIHLELVVDMSTSAFMSALRRFCGRRGLVSDLYSDCGTNFIGASRQIKNEVWLAEYGIKAEVFDQLANQCITWHFIPPGSPHFGGIWEAGVKSTKYHLKRVLGNAKLTFEEFTTLLIQVEACLNSRPLCPLNSDPESCEVLTPGHFLIGDAILTVPEPTLLDLNVHRLNRYQHIQRMLQEFWKKWSMEYLSRLQQRPKWMKSVDNLAIDQIVLVKDERMPPSNWLLGRVVSLHPGSDGLVRVVALKCQGKIVKRPIAKICLLPILDNETDLKRKQ